jgi:hypothetical protein
MQHNAMPSKHILEKQFVVYLAKLNCPIYFIGAGIGQSV